MQWLFALLLLLLIPSVEAWNWQTHSKLVESVYYTLNVSYLDLAALRNGSIAPDRDFHDNRLHHYPPSYNKTRYWLEQTRKALAEGKYSNASYTFGVASHYMGDSFAAPHNIKGETSASHAAYEKQANEGYNFVDCSKIPKYYHFHDTFRNATEQGKTWEFWLLSEEKSIPEQAVEESYVFILQVAQRTFREGCMGGKTTVARGSFLEDLSWWSIALAGVVIAMMLLLAFSLIGGE